MVKLADGKMSIEKQKTSLYLICKMVRLSKMMENRPSFVKDELNMNSVPNTEKIQILKRTAANLNYVT